METVDVIETTEAVNAIRICQIIPTIIILYDHLLTLDREIELVWKKPRTLGRVLFLSNRYFGSFFFLLANSVVFSMSSPRNNASTLTPFHPSQKTNLATKANLANVNLVFIFQGCGTALIIWISQGTMLCCTWAMYLHSPCIRRVALSVFVCEVPFMSVILGVAFAGLRTTSNLTSPLAYEFCIPFHVPNFFYTFWLPVIILDLVHLILAIWTFVSRCRPTFPSATSDILRILTQIVISYSAVTLLVYVTTAVVWGLLPAKWFALPQTLSATVTCLVGIKCILTLRDACYSYSIFGPGVDRETGLVGNVAVDDDTINSHMSTRISFYAV